MQGIYKITNTITKKCYIGQTTNIKRRWNAHKNKYNNPKDCHYNIPLYTEMRKYGINNFKFEIIEECEKERLPEREKYWVKYFDCYKNGYNCTAGGNSGVPNKLSPDQINEIRNLLSATDIENQEIASRYGVSENTISGINTGYYWNDDNIAYPIRKTYANGFLSKKDEKKSCPICGKEIWHYSKLCPSCNGVAHRKVERPSKEELFQLLKEYSGNFSALSKIFGVSDNAIRKWCDHYNLPRKSKDYK